MKQGYRDGDHGVLRHVLVHHLSPDLGRARERHQVTSPAASTRPYTGLYRGVSLQKRGRMNGVGEIE